MSDTPTRLLARALVSAARAPTVRFDEADYSHSRLALVLRFEPSDARATFPIVAPLLALEPQAWVSLVVELDMDVLLSLAERALANKTGRAREGMIEIRRGGR